MAFSALIRPHARPAIRGLARGGAAGRLPGDERLQWGADRGILAAAIHHPHGHRSSSANAFCGGERRPNLQVNSAFAHRIVMEAGRARGVEYARRGRQVRANADRE